MAKLSDIFDVRYGHSLELNRLTLVRREEGIAFVSRKAGDNGIAAYVAPILGLDPAPAGELTCALSANVLATHLQEQPFYAGYHVACLRPKLDLSKAQLLYYCLCIHANRYRYSYGRQANRTLRDLVIPNVEDIPDWAMASNTSLFDGADAPMITADQPGLFGQQWREFEIQKLFDVKKGKRLTKANMRPGPVRFIGAIDSNNGVSCFVDKAIHEGGTLTVNYNGNGVAEAFYQAEPFWASDDVNVLYPKFVMSPAIGLFIATVIRQEKYRFSYGRKWHLERMRTSTIHLPATLTGEPDLAFMETYMQTLPYSSKALAN